ncbi:MAG: hypothetical protein ABIZ04_13230 [Opitutus sp.]
MNQEPDLESESIRSEIDSTRGRMDDTIDQLENRLQGRHLLDEIVGFFRRGDDDGKMGEWREKIGRSAGTVVDSVKAHPLPLILIGAGVGWLIYQNRVSRSSSTRDYDYTDDDYLSSGYESYGSSSSGLESGAGAYGSKGAFGSTGEDISSSASSVAGQAKEKLSELGSQAREKVSNLTERGREKLEAAREKASQLGQDAKERGRQLYSRTRDQVANTANQHPLELGIGFLALGVIAGMAIPTPEAVTRRLNPAAGKLRQAGTDLVEKGKRIAQAATEAARAEAKTQGLTLDRVRDQASAVAQRAGEAAKDSARQEGITTGGQSASDPTSARPSV